MQNYHKHSCSSNVWGMYDSVVFDEDYAKRACELGHKVLSSVEHGWQGKYHTCFELAKKYNLKFIFGTEAYWVKDRLQKDRTNCHIVLLAKNETGRRAINEALSIANEDGYYYRPRLDEKLIMGLPKGDVLITSACVAGWLYEDAAAVFRRIHQRFGADFMLEIQNHNSDKQIRLNRKIAALAKTDGIKLIAGLDSHYVNERQGEERRDILKDSNISFNDADEANWYMDYPCDDEVRARFAAQGVFSPAQVQQAMDNTDCLLEFSDYTSQVFMDNRKLVSLYPNETQQQKDKRYGLLVTKLFKQYMKDVPLQEYDRYYQGVKMEVDTYKQTGMTDYPLLDYELVKRAVARGGLITSTGRGSAVGYFTNTLCGFSKVDRFHSPVKLYPERFISKTRIMESNSLPDLDLNLGNPEIFEEVQRELLGDDHAYPMCAFGTLRKKAAFKLFSRSQKLDFSIANEISKQLARYDDAVKYAEDDDERRQINVYDYVDEKYRSYVDQSKSYWNIVSSKGRAPCAYLLYSGSIRREIGLIRCKSEATKKESITTVIDGAVAEKYKFLKNDLLKVDVVLLIHLIYKRIGIRPHTVDELAALCQKDTKVWAIYAKGLTVGINQCEKESTTQKLKRYKPQNISELTAFIAAIRPGFKSLYEKFESRQPYSYGIKELDALIQTEQFPYSYILYQENLMAVLNYAGFPMDECYGIIKNIAKKHPEKVRPLKAKFIKGFGEKISAAYKKQGKNAEQTAELCERVWQIIDDSTSYSFNAAHALCMAYDSLYTAYLKAHYPYEFYEVMLSVYSDKGKKDKAAALKQEMKRGFNIQEAPIRFGDDNRSFVADPARHCIVPSLLCIKGFSKTTAAELYSLSQNGSYPDFYQVLKAVDTQTRINSTQITTLIKLDYFAAYGSIDLLLKQYALFSALHGRTDIKREELLHCRVQDQDMRPFCQRITDKTYTKVAIDAFLPWLFSRIPSTPVTSLQHIRYEWECLGYPLTTNPQLSQDYYFISEVSHKYSSYLLTLYQICDGSVRTIKLRAKTFAQSPVNPGDALHVFEIALTRKWAKDENGRWYQKQETEEILTKYSLVK